MNNIKIVHQQVQVQVTKHHNMGNMVSMGIKVVANINDRWIKNNLLLVLASKELELVLMYDIYTSFVYNVDINCFEFLCITNNISFHKQLINDI